MRVDLDQAATIGCPSLGNAEAASVVTHSVAVVGRIIEGQGGRVIKTLGDGLMAVFPLPNHAVRAAEEVHDSLERVIDTDVRFQRARLRDFLVPQEGLQFGGLLGLLGGGTSIEGTDE